MKYLPFRILAALLIGGPAHAQYDQAQLVRPAEAADLNGHLARLASDPRDVAALIGAGEAALALDDPRAAAGFFARADAIESGNGRIKAGLARVMLQMQNPAEALRLFDQATRLGYPDNGFLSDRALARDLTGDQAGAQRDYQAALKAKPDDAEVVRRYAASLGISGQVAAAEKVLEPLLYKSDRAAWRYRAFILAMNNRQDEAKKIADQTMPAQLATAITPYMQKMPYLTAAQKAAAVHFGHFPTTVGTRIAAVTPTPPASTGAPEPAPASAPTTTAAAASVQAAPARTDRRSRQAETRAQRRTRLAQAATTPPVPTAPSATVPPTSTATPAAAPAGQPASTPPAAQQPVQQQAAPLPASQSQPVRQATNEVQGPPTPGFESVDTAQAPASTAPAPTTGQPAAAAQLNAITLAQASGSVAPATGSTPAPSAAAPSPAAQPAPAMVQPLPAQPAPARQQPDPVATRTLSDIIRAIDVPDSERQSSVAAVDLAEVQRIQMARRAERDAAAEKVKKAAAAKAKAEADAKAKKEAEEKARLAANPSRNWLQIGTGANKGALAFTMRNLRKKYADIAPQDAWTASWGQTNRLLVGPFASFTRAKSLEEKLKGAGADAFAWKSDAGEVVERLAGK